MTAPAGSAAGAGTVPTVSVLVPIYNVERYLDECLASLRAQTFENFEVLCINDGSTDGSSAIIDRYRAADPRFRVIDKPNSGYGASMNRGLAEARGEFVAILESDDFLEPEGLAALHRAIVAADADVAKANFWLYWSTPRVTDVFHEAFTRDQCGRVVDPAAEQAVFHAKPSIWSALYRRSFLDEHAIRFLETPGASFQDLSFTFKVWASSRRVTFVHEPYVHYRQDNENSSVNSLGKVNAVFDEYAEIGRWLDVHPDLRAVFAPTRTKMLYDSCIWNYQRVAPDLKVELLEKARDVFLAEQRAGTLDVRLFEPRKLLAFRTIVLSPEQFHREEQARRRSLRTLAEGVVRNFNEGGARRVLDVTKARLRAAARR